MVMGAEERLGFFDIAKGFAMICIIAGHLGIGTINSFVFTFHVPIFFLISGYFLKENISVKEYAYKKKNQLIIPYVVTCTAIIFGVTLGDIIKNHCMENFVLNLKIWTIASIYGSGSIEYTTPFYMKQIGALWFLLALFEALLIVRYFMSYRYAGIIIAIIAYIGYKTTDMLWLPFSIQAGMTATLFVYLGMLSRKYKVLERKVSPVILSGLIGIWLCCILFCGKLYMVRNYYENGILDVLGALSGSYLVLVFSRIVEERTKYLSRILKFYGKNSLLMMCCHAFELNVVSWDWIWLFFGEKLQFQTYIVWWILIFFKMLFCTMGIYMIKGLQKLFKKFHIESWRDKAEGLTKIIFSNNANRIQYWDVAKGITIMLMILGHTNVPTYLWTIIFSFHMPVFIIINGYFIRNYDIKRTFKRSVKTLLLPYFVTCIVSAFIYAFMKNGESGFLEPFLYKIKAMVGGMSKISTKFQNFDSVGVVWFVCCLFIARNLYVILMKLLEKYSEVIRISVVIILAILGLGIGKYYAFLPWSFDVALVSLVFIAFGNWMRRTKFLEKNYFYTLIVPAAVWIYFLKLGICIELATRSYPLGVFCFVEALAGSLVVISISKYLSRYAIVTNILAWIGKNSMLILITHCFELMYFNWNEWIYARLPFTINWFRVFVIKSIVILIIVGMIAVGRKGIKKVIFRWRN